MTITISKTGYLEFAKMPSRFLYNPQAHFPTGRYSYQRESVGNYEIFILIPRSKKHTPLDGSRFVDLQVESKSLDIPQTINYDDILDPGEGTLNFHTHDPIKLKPATRVVVLRQMEQNYYQLPPEGSKLYLRQPSLSTMIRLQILDPAARQSPPTIVRTIRISGRSPTSAQQKAKKVYTMNPTPALMPPKAASAKPSGLTQCLNRIFG